MELGIENHYLFKTVYVLKQIPGTKLTSRVLLSFLIQICHLYTQSINHEKKNKTIQDL